MKSPLQNTLAKLDYFANAGAVTLFDPITADIIDIAESILHCKFSLEMTEFFQYQNGMQLFGEHVAGIYSPGSSNLPKELDIVGKNLHNRSLRWWPSNWLEIGQDSFGNYYIANLDLIVPSHEYEIFWIDHESFDLDAPHTKVISRSYFGFLEWLTQHLIDTYDRSGLMKY